MLIGLLGAGLMGQAICERLLTKDYRITAYNRTAAKLDYLADLGATTMTSAQSVIDASDVCILFLSDAAAINSVLSSVDTASFENKYFIQMGTIAPEESKDIATFIRSHNGHYLECPVLGSLPEARNGTLILMAAGDNDDFDKLLPLLKDMGPKPVLLGDIGKGSTIKLAMNQLIAGLTSSFALSLALVKVEGVDSEQFMNIVRDSALYASTYDKKLQRMLDNNFEQPNFPTKHLAKDTKLFIDVAKQQELESCALEGIYQLLNKTLDLGLADTDYSALYAGVTRNKTIS